VLKIHYYGDPVLRKRSEPIEEITDEIKKFILEMIKLCDENRGAGLAACQVGRSIRVFILRNYIISPDGKWSQSEPIVFINPKVIEHSEETDVDTEGCLSVPIGQVGPIERPIRVTIEAQDLEGNTFIDKREGLNARVSLHENDHLNGVLQIDRLPPNERKKIEPDLRVAKKKYHTT